MGRSALVNELPAQLLRKLSAALVLFVSLLDPFPVESSLLLLRVLGYVLRLDENPRQSLVADRCYFLDSAAVDGLLLHYHNWFLIPAGLLLLGFYYFVADPAWICWYLMAGRNGLGAVS